jgi:DNA-binding MarR family transcriptional regulator
MSLIPPSDVDQILNIRILRLASKLTLIFQRETLRPAGIKVQQWRIMVSLAQFDELHLRSLARHSSQDPAHTSRVVKSMIAAGWVNSRPDDHDQRRIQYTLTDDGVKIVKDIWPRAQQFASDIAALFEADAFDQFKSMLDIAGASCDARLSNSGS